MCTLKQSVSAGLFLENTSITIIDFESQTIVEENH